MRFRTALHLYVVREEQAVRMSQHAANFSALCALPQRPDSPVAPDTFLKIKEIVMVIIIKE